MIRHHLGVVGDEERDQIWRVRGSGQTDFIGVLAKTRLYKECIDGPRRRSRSLIKFSQAKNLSEFILKRKRITKMGEGESQR